MILTSRRGKVQRVTTEGLKCEKKVQILSERKENSLPPGKVTETNGSFDIAIINAIKRRRVLLDYVKRRNEMRGVTLTFAAALQLRISPKIAGRAKSEAILLLWLFQLLFLDSEF